MKEESRVPTADWGGYPRVVRGRGRPQGWPIRSEAAPGAGDDVGTSSSSPQMNHPSAKPGRARDRPAPGILTQPALKGQCHSGSSDRN